jgi:magnesium transporter
MGLQDEARICVIDRGEVKRMVKIYMTDDRVVYELEERREGAWIMLTNPTVEELQEVARDEIDIADLRAALDDEESSRIELEDGYTLILVDIPTTEIRNELKTYTTIPLGIILTQENIITVCTEETPILTQFVNKRVRDFSTKKKMRFIYQILFRTAAMYQSTLRIIDKQRTEIEEEIGDMTEDKDLFQLHELESTLVYFATSLRANAVVLERLTRYKRLEQFPEDMELLEDVIVENQQAVEMTTIYKDILIGTRELLSAVLNNRLNNVMKYLTTITLVMAVPTVVSGLFGMNVPVPFANRAFAFGGIAICTFLVCILVLILLKRKKML